FEATVVLDVFNLRTERIEMRDDGPGGEPLFAASDSANGAAPGQFRLHAEALQFLCHMTDDRVRIASGAVDRKQRLQLLRQIGNIDLQTRHLYSPHAQSLARSLRPGTGEQKVQEAFGRRLRLVIGETRPL